jgi:hypothetical protein
LWFLVSKTFSGAAPSLWIWFYAIAETPEAALASRESLIGELGQPDIGQPFPDLAYRTNDFG